MCEDPSLICKDWEVALVTYLMAPVNRGRLLEMIMKPADGKRLTVEGIYIPRPLLNEVDTVISDTCVSTNQAGHKFTTFTIDKTKGVQHGEAYDLQDLTDMCESNELWFETILLRLLNVCDRKAEQLAWLDVAGGLTGAFGLGEENVANFEKTVQTLTAAGDPDRRFVQDVEFSTVRAAFCPSPAFFGWAEPWKSWKDFESGCCYDGGVDIGALFAKFPKVFFPSNEVEQAFGVNHFIAATQGALQLVIWNKYKSTPDGDINFLNDGAHKRMKITSPKTGITYDMIVERVCDDISILLKSAMEVHGMPDDMYDDGDNFEGVKGVLEYVINNP